MVVLCTVTELICNISFGSTASLYSLSMEIREAEFFYGKQINMDKSGIVFLFRPFLFVSCYPHGKVPGSDLDIGQKLSLFWIN